MRIDLSGTRKKAMVAGVGLVLVGAALAAAHSAHAAEEQRRGGRGGRGAWMGGERGGAPGGAFLPLRLLELSEEQREQVRTLMEENRGAARGQRSRMRAAREALAEAVSSAEVDEDRIRTLTAEVGRLTGDAAVRRARTYAAVWQILTPEQRERAEEIEAEREERRSARRDRMQERRERREQRRQERDAR
jgi:Spy/CpxP family protein refolding chaperone